MDSTNFVLSGDDLRGATPVSDDEEDYARDYVQFSGNAGASTAEWRGMEEEDKKRWDSSRREFLEFQRLRPMMTGVVINGKISRFPQRAPRFSAGDPVGSSSPVFGADVPVRKKCDKCGFVVLWEGHEARCRVPAASDSVHSDRVRSMAWLGDAVHTLDVRRFLLVVGTPVAELEVRAQEYRGGHVRARYYRDFPGVEPIEEVSGKPESALATLFNASYCGDYRRKYLRRVLSIEARDVGFPGYLEPHFRGFPFGGLS